MTAWAQPKPKRTCDVSIILGTYNRRKALERCIKAARNAVERLSYEIVVCDGGSTDGSREWLVSQRDVLFVGDRRLTGAVAAFNMGFALSHGRYIATLNDDCEPEPKSIVAAVERLEAGPLEVAQAALALNVGQAWSVNEIHGVPWANYGVVRREAAERVAAICGGLWCPAYVTYGADVELSLWLWRLGYRVEPQPDLRVANLPVEDELRAKNRHSGLSTKEAVLLYHRWPSEAHVRGDKEPVVDWATLRRLRAAVVGRPE